MAEEYDVVVLGGGTGGYVAAIRAAQLGLKTAIVERSKLGGTCLHEGCIPTKALLKSAAAYQFVKKAENFGVEVGIPAFRWDLAQQRKEEVVARLHQGVQALVAKGKIDVYTGIGRILGPSIFSPMPGTISVEQLQGENEMLLPKYVVIATGASPKALPKLPFDEDKIVDSSAMLKMKTLPKTVCIIGGGVIGVEWASMLADLDVAVTIIEASPAILPTEDEDIVREMTKQLQAKGVQIITDAHFDPEQIVVKDRVTIDVTTGDQKQRVEAEKVLVSIGRTGNVHNIGLENTAAIVNDGFIQVNEHYQTKERHIYAIGDVIGNLQLAHVAAKEAVRAVEHIAGVPTTPLHYKKIARCIYSSPEIASVGLTEREAKERYTAVKVAKIPLTAIGKALVNGQGEGFAKMVVDAHTDDIVGMHLIGSEATELIAHSALALYVNASAWELGEIVYPHPSVAEVFGEAALSIQGKAIHY